MRANFGVRTHSEWPHLRSRYNHVRTVSLEHPLSPYGRGRTSNALLGYRNPRETTANTPPPVPAPAQQVWRRQQAVEVALALVLALTSTGGSRRRSGRQRYYK